MDRFKQAGQWWTANLVTPLEVIGYGSGVPTPPIPEPPMIFWVVLLIFGLIATNLVLGLKG